jgi:hypothetical protein
LQRWNRIHKRQCLLQIVAVCSRQVDNGETLRAAGDHKVVSILRASEDSHQKRPSMIL